MKSLTVVTNTNAVATNTKTTPPAKIIAELEEIESIAHHEMRLWADLNTDIYNSVVTRLTAAVATAKSYLEDTEYQESADVLNLATTYAKEDEIGRELKQLLGAWPNTGKSDLAMFGALLTVEVRAKALSRYALMAACRKLRTTAKFLPVIAEVLEAVSDAETRIQRIAACHHELPGRLAEAQQTLAYYAAKATRQAEEDDWKQAALDKAAGKCSGCGSTSFPQLYIRWTASDRSDAVALCRPCWTGPR